jgi:archaemetzincin
MLAGTVLLILASHMTDLKVVAIGEVESTLVDTLCVGLERVLPVKIAAREWAPLDHGAYDAGRRQHVAAAVLRELTARADGLVLAVVDVDLYAPGLNFVFGQAEPGSGRAIVSTARLRPQAYGHVPNIELLRRRILTEAVHEVGHLFRLGHCANASCAMHFSNSLADTDRKGPGLCNACRGQLGLP